MKSPQLAINKVDKGENLSGSLPSINQPTTQPAADNTRSNPYSGLEPSSATSPDNSLNIQLPSNLRDHSKSVDKSGVAATQKNLQTVSLAVAPQRDVITRLITWAANLIKKLEIKLLERLESLPLISSVIFKKRKNRDEYSEQ